MAKITRKFQKLFCDVSPTGVLGQFGSFADDDKTYSNDPDTIQSRDAFGAGWASALINNAPPAIQDMDGLFYLIFRQLSYAMQGGIPEYNSATEYHKGSLVSDGVKSVFVSVSDTNEGNALSDETKWMIFLGGETTTTSADTVDVACDDSTLLVGESGGSYPVLVMLPAAAATNKGRMIAVKKLFAAGTGNVSVQTYGGNIDAAASLTISTKYQTKRFVSDGTDWLII